MVTRELQGLRDSGNILDYDKMLRCYGVTGSIGETVTYFIIRKVRYDHVSVWLHESYKGYGSLEKYCIMIKFYDVTG